MSEKRKNIPFHMVTMALITAVLSVVAPFSIPLPFTPIPLSLTTFILYLSLYLFGGRNTFYSCALYLLLGLTGIPVFSGFSGGVGKLLGPTGGFLIGYLFIPLCGGIFLTAKRHGKLTALFGFLLGTLCCYFLGAIWYSFQSGLSLPIAFFTTVVPFLPGDIIKILLALFTAPAIHSRLQKASIL